MFLFTTFAAVIAITQLAIARGGHARHADVTVTVLKKGVVKDIRHSIHHG